MSPLLQGAIAAHQAGRIAEAEGLYVQALSFEPANGVAQHYFGLLRYQQGRLDEAMALMGGARRLVAANPGMLSHYALVLQAKGLLQEALQQLDQAVSLDSKYAEGFNNRGAVLCQLGRFEEGVASFDAGLRINPKAVDALCNRSIALCFLGRLPEALAGYDRAVALQPNDPNLVAARGGVLNELGRHADALVCYDKALALGGPTHERLHHRALVLLRLDRLEEALRSIDEALALQPAFTPAWVDRAAILQSLGRDDDSLASLDRAEALDPANAAAKYSRGLTLRVMGRHAEALAALDAAVRLAPNWAEPWNDKGVILYFDLRRPEEAEASLRRCLALAPGHVGAFTNLGVMYWRLDRIDEAKAAFDEALKREPDHATNLYNRATMVWARQREFRSAAADLRRLLKTAPAYPFALGDLTHMKGYAGDWSDHDAELAAIDRGVREGRAAAVPFVYAALSGSPEDMQACARAYATSRHPTRAPQVPRERGGDKIRIGYVCGEFREQATSHLAVGLFERHDRDRFEVIAFDNGAGDGSAMRTRLEAAFDRMIPISGLNDTAAAQAVLDEKIDVLVNLNGYYGSPRNDVFARRPAPVQVNFLGFPGTLGAPYMDYIIADRTVIPEDERRFYDEQVVWLPDSYQVNDDRRPLPQPAADRAAHGLPKDGFVFCYFNHAYKLNPETFSVWMGILSQVDGSVLWLLDGVEPFQDNIRREAKARGMDPARIVFAPVLDHQEHLARLPLGDLFLDGLPYNAHTTASDALWMGLPVLTRLGTSFPGRVAASVLDAAGLPELVTRTTEDFQAEAVALATDPGRLAALRDKLAANRSSAPLFDTALYARQLEAVYEVMINTWRAGRPPTPISVPPVF